MLFWEADFCKDLALAAKKNLDDSVKRSELGCQIYLYILLKKIKNGNNCS